MQNTGRKYKKYVWNLDELEKVYPYTWIPVASTGMEGASRQTQPGGQQMWGRLGRMRRQKGLNVGVLGASKPTPGLDDSLGSLTGLSVESYS